MVVSWLSCLTPIPAGSVSHYTLVFRVVKLSSCLGLLSDWLVGLVGWLTDWLLGVLTWVATQVDYLYLAIFSNAFFMVWFSFFKKSFVF